VAAAETQATLRGGFARRGLPERIRVDKGTPWGSRGDLPTGLELWRAGLGVEVRANPPRRPQDNGVVERSQGTGKRWAEPHRAGSAEGLQASLDAMDRRQRESDPDHGRASRLAAHPDLEHSGRADDASREQEWWSMDRVGDLLAGSVVPRRVDGQGTASVSGRNDDVGQAYAEQVVYVRSDPQQESWRFQDGPGHQLNRRKAEEITAASIRELMVPERRVRSGTTEEVKPPSQFSRNNLMSGDSTPQPRDVETMTGVGPSGRPIPGVAEYRRPRPPGTLNPSLKNRSTLAGFQAGGSGRSISGGRTSMKVHHGCEAGPHQGRVLGPDRTGSGTLEFQVPDPVLSGPLGGDGRKGQGPSGWPPPRGEGLGAYAEGLRTTLMHLSFLSRNVL
jgi:hypothetical protein